MKSLVEYITDITGEDQEAIMKPMRIMAEQHGQDEALWNTEQDRWSRRAKHPLRVNEVSTEDGLTWEKGEMAFMDPVRLRYQYQMVQTAPLA